MNPTIKEGEADQETIQWIVSPLNVKRFHYEDHDQLKIHLADYMSVWPAAGFVDTEIRCLTELESWNAEKEVQPRVQA